ncbi:hypothetical protein KFE25_000653 [Diacronema lutheri]|uniref:Deacetylase sirtuin-type domain-containing protein n=1 Tax=Diacronema lutheri TaxID=2081491 RepID=A0A8J5XRW7_DIALT|nr:hypothetical protein KFE25_000653 [Diacronema lutheri]
MKAPRLVANSREGVAGFLRSEACANVGVLAGAGVSVAAGIPDFRSPTGLYATLPVDRISATAAQRELIRREPTYVVERGMFLQTALPYLEVRRPFILGTHEGRWRPTAAHRLFEALDAQRKLARVYTQNIDGLDLMTSIARERIVCVHGTLGRAACEACGHEADFDDFARRVRAGIKDIYDVDPSAPAASSPVACACCGALSVKPMTVLFGGALPADVFAREWARICPLSTCSSLRARRDLPAHPRARTPRALRTRRY